MFNSLKVLAFLLISISSLCQDSLLVFPSYSIQIPSGWTVKEGCLELECTLLSPADTLGTYDTYIESINITANDLKSSSYTADKYADFSIGYLPKVVKNFQVIERKKVSNGGVRVTYSGVKNLQMQTWRQYYYKRNGKMYIVTFSAQTSKYAYHQELAEPFLNSFSFK